MGGVLGFEPFLHFLEKVLQTAMVLIIYGLMKLSSPLFPERRASFQRGICISCFMTRKLILTFPSFPPRPLLIAENRQSASVCALADCGMT